jgi:hypothetical protein|tara:strand:+ start:1230 stop:1334 length:105 start_codon:yes stop_codon:yes gene_type:complete
MGNLTDDMLFLQELMEMFAKLNGRTLNPVFVDYR